LAWRTGGFFRCRISVESTPCPLHSRLTIFIYLFFWLQFMDHNSDSFRENDKYILILTNPLMLLLCLFLFPLFIFCFVFSIIDSVAGNNFKNKKTKSFQKGQISNCHCLCQLCVSIAFFRWRYGFINADIEG
jgi:hypothetical protein